MAGDFSELFNVSRLDERQIGQITYILHSPAYEHSFKPYMEGVLRALAHLRRDRSQKRKDEYSDDYIAGGEDFGEGLLKFFSALIDEVSTERVMQQLENLTPEQFYTMQQQRGKVKPVVGINQPALPAEVDPAEDF